jgi:nicotinamidase-related amidase
MNQILRLTALMVLVLMIPLFYSEVGRSFPEEKTELRLTLRSKKEIKGDKKDWATELKEEKWIASKTAVVVCDMWDKHWSNNASVRVGEMAPTVNLFLKKAREKGATIIHCPSDTLEFYKDTPQRLLAKNAPVITTKIPLMRWCKLDPTMEEKLPIDDTDGGDDSVPKCKNYRAWTRQIDALEIFPQDAITDSAEAFYLMKQKGITHVLVLGVHTNMCVLGRPFSIRQMVQQGMKVALVRDLTDTMYNPEKAPFVTHFTGTDLVVEHIEKFWCPTISSNQILGGKEFRFKEDKRPRVLFVAAEDAYKSRIWIPEFALARLGKEYQSQFAFSSEARFGSLPGLNMLDSADLLVLSLRRRGVPEEEMKMLKEYISQGKALLAIRTATHGFAPNVKLPIGYAEWKDFDKEVLGCNYQGHEVANSLTQVMPVLDQFKNINFDKVKNEKLASHLYKVNPLAKDAKVLLEGKSVPGGKVEPVAWMREKPKGRVGCFTLGHFDEMKHEEIQAVLKSMIDLMIGKRDLK